ncbi:unnamed protein product [Aphanomyces euteiches]|nr:hypothetical protein Ae201684P_004933 [Aphanomyces euteiches]
MVQDSATDPKGDSKQAARPRADWTTETKSKFNACQTNKQKAAWWAWLSARLNVHINAQFTPKQVKNKFTALKAEYRSLVAAEMETGNLEDKIKYPNIGNVCWIACRLHLLPLADSLHIGIADGGLEQEQSCGSDNDASCGERETSERQMEDLKTIKPEGSAGGSHQKKQEKNKTLGECLVQGMGSMAEAMIQVAKMQSNGGSSTQSLLPISTKIDQRLEEQSESNKAQTAINEAILLALQALKGLDK